MSFSIATSTPFTSIDWNTFENRPEINDSMPFCTEENWDKNVKCCMDGYSIESVLEQNSGRGRKRKEVSFLEQYPCVNGPELESLAEGAARPGKDPSEIPVITPLPFPSPTNDDSTCDSRAVNAFLKFVKSVGLDDQLEASRLKQSLKISCEALIDLAVRYGRASR